MKHIVIWNKYRSKVTTQTQNQYLDFLIDPIFPGVNSLFVMTFEKDQKSSKRLFNQTTETKHYKYMIYWRNISDQPIKNYERTCDNIWKIANGHGDDYTTGALLDHPSFKKNYEMAATDLRKQQTLDADPKAAEQINLSVNLDRVWNATMFSLLMK